MSVTKLLNRLELNRESVLLIRNKTLVPGDDMLADTEYLTLAEKAEVRATLVLGAHFLACLLYTSPSPRDRTRSRMPSSA